MNLRKPIPDTDPNGLPITQGNGCQWCAHKSDCLMQHVSPASEPLLAEAIRERAFHTSDVISTQGETSTTLAVVKVGTVMGTRRAPGGVEVPVALFGRGRVLGTSAMLGQSNALAIRALSAGRLCVVDIADLYRMGATDRQFLDKVYARLSDNLGRLADWAAIMHIKGLKRQLLLALRLIGHEQGSRSIRLPAQAALAALLSTSRESIARYLVLLEQEGLLIRIDRWHCEIVDPLEAANE